MFKSNKKALARKNRQNGRRLLLESLQSRQLMAADVFDAALSDDGVLSIQGSEQSDTIEVRELGETVRVTMSNGTDRNVQAFSTDRIGRIEINGQAGDDTIRNDTSHYSIIKGGEGNDELYGGSGWDDLHGEAGDDRLDGGEGWDKLHGGYGDDTFITDTEDHISNSWPMIISPPMTNSSNESVELASDGESGPTNESLNEADSKSYDDGAVEDATSTMASQQDQAEGETDQNEAVENNPMAMGVPNWGECYLPGGCEPESPDTSVKDILTDDPSTGGKSADSKIVEVNWLAQQEKSGQEFSLADTVADLVTPKTDTNHYSHGKSLATSGSVTKQLKAGEHIIDTQARGSAEVFAGAEGSTETRVGPGELYAKAEGFAGARATVEGDASASTDIDGLKLAAEASGMAEARAGVEGEALAKFDKDGAVAQAEAFAGTAVEAVGDAEASIGVLDVGAGGEVLARAGAEADAGLSATKEGLKGSVGAFAGASADAKGSVNLGAAQATAVGEAWAGVGVEADATATLKDGKLKLGFEFGAALGIGGKTGLGLEIDFKKMGQDLKEAGKEIEKLGTVVVQSEVAEDLNEFVEATDDFFKDFADETERAAKEAEEAFVQQSLQLVSDFDQAARHLKEHNVQSSDPVQDLGISAIKFFGDFF